MDSVLGTVPYQLPIRISNFCRGIQPCCPSIQVADQPFSSTLKLKFDVAPFTMNSTVSLAMQILIHLQALIMYALYYAALDGLKPSCC